MPYLPAAVGAISPYTIKYVSVDIVAPTLSSVEVGNVADDIIVLTYDEALDTGSVPATGDFSIAGTSETVSSVAVSGATVRLTMSGDIYILEVILASYTAGTNKIRDLAENNAANFTNEAVTNNSSTPMPELDLFTAEWDGATQMDIDFYLPIGKTIWVHWGDANTSKIEGTGAAVTPVSSYAGGAASYDITISGHTDNLTRIRTNSSEISGSITTLANFAGLTNFYAGTNNSLSGDISGLTNITILYLFGSTTVTGDISAMTWLEEIYIVGTNTITGSIAALASTILIHLAGNSNVSGSIVGLASITDLWLDTNTVSGSMAGLSTLEDLQVYGTNTITGDISSLTVLDSLRLRGNNTISGSPAAATGLRYINVEGSNTLAFDLNDLSTDCYYIKITPNRIVTYTQGHDWSSVTNNFIVEPAVGYGLSSDEVDDIIIDFNSVAFDGNIILLGSNAPRTSASDAAVTAIEGRGGAITTTDTPVHLIIDYTATQFVFKCKAPSGKTIILHEGDGTTQTINGADGSLITKTTSYVGAGTRDCWLTGDVTDLTYIDIQGQAFVSGDVSTWSQLVNLTRIYCSETSVSGDISSFSSLTSIERVYMYSSNVTGDISGWSTLINMVYLQCYSTSLTGDISGFDSMTGLLILKFANTDIDFDSVTTWTNPNTLELNDCAMSSAQVDNMIESFSTCTSSTINVAGDNDHRTAASNDDLNTLLDNGNTITLNDTLSAEKVTNGSFTLGADLNTLDCENAEFQWAYTTFTNVTPTGFDVTNDGTDTQGAGTAQEISFISGHKYLVSFDCVLNGGLTAPIYNLQTGPTNTNISVEGPQTAQSGLNAFTFTASQTVGTSILGFQNNSTTADFTIRNLSVKEVGTYWDVTDASWNIVAEVAVYDDANNDAGILQVDGDMVSVIAINTVYRLEFTTDATPTTAAIAIKNSAEDVVYFAQADYTDDDHVVYFTTPGAIGGGGLAFVAYQSGDAFDLDDVSLKTVTLS